MPVQSQPPPAGRLSGFQIGILVLLVVALLGSVAWRAHARGAGRGGELAHGLVGEREAPAEPAATPFERSLPYFTEGSLFGLIGFALGYASRKFVKLALLLLALFFLGLQALVWTGTVSVDWSGMIGKLNALVFNLRENETISAFLTRRIPSGGGMLLGYWVGFQRG
jgi:uncharacterized membrane protein (Fun14 family)